jgi:DNA modification methylase
MSEPTVRLIHGDCLEVLKTLGADSVDAVITDPPYPEIDRPYGRMTEADWHVMMRGVVAECRRILKPTGSAVFILQPNSERVGRMRPWLWEFMAWTTREWNMPQDAWWWNHETLPKTKNDPNLLRTSLKACVWLGGEDCYRNGADVLWEESDSNRAARMAGRCTNDLRYTQEHGSVRAKQARSACVLKGGVTAFNVLPIGADGKSGAVKHPGRTPQRLADWWTRYISPPGGVVCDPFIGAGTMGLAALARGRSIIGIERDPTYFATAERRIAEAGLPLLEACK